MQNNYLKAGLLALAILVIFIFSWEVYLRSKGFTISYDDGNALWADKRARVYSPTDKATVFIGSSRIKYDLDIPTWTNLTGEEAVQLAMEGNSPLPILHDLAEDEKFKGKLVIDVTEGLFFSDKNRRGGEPGERIEYAKKRTPSQIAGFAINHFLESQLVLLDKDNTTANAYLDKLEVASRPGIDAFPIFPMEFNRCQFNRQSKMTDRFLSDTTLQNKVKAIWGTFGKRNKDKPPTGLKLDSIIADVKIDIDKIKQRGGQVVFVRTPSSGAFWAIEFKVFPKDQYWNKLLTVTGCQGIHFKDVPAMANFVCPEFSHLSPYDAIKFTNAFVPELQKLGWKFSNRTASTSIAYTTKN